MIEYFNNLDILISKRFLENMDYNSLFYMLTEKISISAELKGMISALFFWFLWFSYDGEKTSSRNKLWGVAVATVFAIAVGRLLANFLPFRQRPIANSEVMGDQAASNEFLEEWSSMPSDHAVMFFALATGFYLISKKVGFLAFFHAAIIVCLPRVLIGLHYLSDIIVGALIGIVISLIVVNVISVLLEKSRKREGVPDFILYPFLFFVTYNFATMFNGIREIGGIAKILLEPTFPT